MNQTTDRGTTCIHGTATGNPCGQRLNPRSTFYCPEHLSEPAKRWRPSRGQQPTATGQRQLEAGQT